MLLLSYIPFDPSFISTQSFAIYYLLNITLYYDINLPLILDHQQFFALILEIYIFVISISSFVSKLFCGKVFETQKSQKVVISTTVLFPNK